MMEDSSLQSLQSAWKRQAAPSISMQQLQKRIRAAEAARRRLMVVEVSLTVVACLVLVLPWLQDRQSPSVWLLTPFFAVFLPLVWWWSLREDRKLWSVLGQSTADFCRARLRQIAHARRRLWSYRLGALALLVYALAAFSLVQFGVLGAELHGSSVFLAAFSLVWAGSTAWLARRRQRRLDREQALLLQWQDAQS